MSKKRSVYAKASTDKKNKKPKSLGVNKVFNTPNKDKAYRFEIDAKVHNPTRESLQELKNYIANEKDEEKRGYAEIAYDEAEFWYYSPINDKEESELLLVKMIREKEDQIFDQQMKVDAAKFELEKYAFDKKIHVRILKSQSKKQAEKWKYNYMDDFTFSIENRLIELGDSIAYDEEWLKQAKKVITTERYKDLPADYFCHNHFDFDGVSPWDDDPEECKCCCHKRLDKEMNEYGNCGCE